MATKGKGAHNAQQEVFCLVSNVVCISKSLDYEVPLLLLQRFIVACWCLWMWFYLLIEFCCVCSATRIDPFAPKRHLPYRCTVYGVHSLSTRIYSTSRISRNVREHFGGWRTRPCHFSYQ